MAILFHDDHSISLGGWYMSETPLFILFGLIDKTEPVTVKLEIYKILQGLEMPSIGTVSSERNSLPGKLQKFLKPLPLMNAYRTRSSRPLLLARKSPIRRLSRSADGEWFDKCGIPWRGHIEVGRSDAARQL
jgi:hypothetical protein